jgi:preprotein translocase subunit SecA
LPEDQPIENSLVSKAIEQSQIKVEGFNFDIRKRLVDFDDVANQQREVVYKLRRNILESDNLKAEIQEKLIKRVEGVVINSWPEYEGSPDYDRIMAGFLEMVPFDDASIKKIRGELEKKSERNEVKEFLKGVANDVYKTREEQVGSEVMRQIEKYAYLGSLDHLWIDHIDHIDSLRESITLRAYGQRDPLVEFKNEAFGMFESLLDRIEGELTTRLFRIGIATPSPEILLKNATTNVDKTDMTGVSEPVEENVVKKKSIGRNDPCWCGSGKKWKKCHYPKLG